MIDARYVPGGTTICCDLCIVGAGAAGITLAHELRDSGMSIVVLESGGRKPNTVTRSLDQGEVNERHHPPLDLYRHRCLGGATTTWGGRCAPFDPIDFQPRSHVPHSGWPITRSQLDPYYARAHAYCEIGTYSYHTRELLAQTKTSFIVGLNSADLKLDDLYLFSPPTDFGQAYVDALERSPHIQILQYATCLDIETNPEGTVVELLRVASVERNIFHIQPRRVILATGALEVTRLLLLSNAVHRQGIGNRYDQLGRFYTSHINYLFDVEFTHPQVLSWDFEKTLEGIYCQHRIAIAEEKQLQYGLLNHRFFVDRPDPSDPSHGNGGLSTAYLIKSLLKLNQYEKQHYAMCNPQCWCDQGSRYTSHEEQADLQRSIPPQFPQRRSHKSLSRHLHNVLTDMAGTMHYTQKLLLKRKLIRRKLPSVIASKSPTLYTFRVDSEQCPNPSSRITLSDRRDMFGLPQLRVDWRYTDLDVQSIEKSVQILSQAFMSCGVGRIPSCPTFLPRAQGGHHLGTTRMANAPQRGVVDVNCRVHGLQNLYIASSSVFPTASYANPTLTVVAIAIRLADHLKQLYSNGTEIREIPLSPTP